MMENLQLKLELFLQVIAYAFKNVVNLLEQTFLILN